MSEAWCLEVDKRLATLEAKMDILVKSGASQENLLKYVVTPLLLIVGALVGVKLIA